MLEREKHQVYIGLGTNLGNRIHTLHAAVKALAELSLDPLACSAVYETRPVGYVDQSKFLNMAVSLYTKADPLSLLGRLTQLETEFGRVRDIRYGPRTLDLDILLYDDAYVCFKHLQIPHPRMWERAFVLVPLADLAPHRRALGGKIIRACADELSEEGDVQYVGRFW
jgi:2-amino-4-hydroxy-6-hydroxymethyldihydropteridine diphosphokinase